MTDLRSRRRLLGTLAACLGGGGWLPGLADAVAAAPHRRRSCILLWMSGGPSQTDTFDLKPGHENGGEFSEIATAAPGLRFSEHLPQLAQQADRLAVLRGLSTGEGDHGRGSYLMRTGEIPTGGGPVRYPSIGASLANQLSGDGLGLPPHVSIGAFRALAGDAFGPGYLGPKFGPLFVAASDLAGAGVPGPDGYPRLEVESIRPPDGIDQGRMNRRVELWRQFQTDFTARRSVGAAAAQNEVYEGALRLMNSRDAQAFNLAAEPATLRQAYGNTVFGQGCLLARRLVERGVPFVEVSLGTNSSGVGWDTHLDNFNAVQNLSEILDAGWSTLMTDLADRGLLETTTILWMGEFGRTPRINGTGGRDHFPDAWSAVLAGGGIAGGQAYGRTSADGTVVEDGRIGVQDLLSTLCAALGLGGSPMNEAPNGRPMPVAEGRVIDEVLA